jgi:NAD(P)-dependent dehydrogenase (short-subunit alcohol dehydrogenase family)
MAMGSDSIALSLASKVAIVSGSSSGIGAAVARELSLRGAHVIINYPFESEKQNATKVLQSLPGTAKSIIVEADLSTTTGPTKLVEAATAEFGSIDILVNNAGVAAPSALQEPDDEVLLKSWDLIVNLNGRGTLLLTRAVLKHLARKHSRIVNICSTTSRNPEPNMSIYAGSKGMIESFTKCWARDLPREYGCTVNTIAPGPVATEALQAAPPHVLETIMQTCRSTPVASRMAEPSEVAWMVATLCEERAGWLNGLYIPVAGGSTLG